MIGKSNSSIKYSWPYKLLISASNTEFLHGFQNKAQFYKINAMALLKSKSIASIRKSFQYHLSFTTTSTARRHVELSDENLGLGLSFEVTS